MNTFQTKQHRLQPNLYRGNKRATFTICIDKIKPLFVDPSIVSQFISFLDEAHERFKCVNWAFVFMPDHAHILSEGKCGQSDLLGMIGAFKQRSGFWLARHNPGFKWQKGSYDHIHRKEDDLVKHLLYILENPVRKGIVQRWEDYPFAGSLNFDLKMVLSSRV